MFLCACFLVCIQSALFRFSKRELCRLLLVLFAGACACVHLLVVVLASQPVKLWSPVFMLFYVVWCCVLCGMLVGRVGFRVHYHRGRLVGL